MTVSEYHSAVVPPGLRAACYSLRSVEYARFYRNIPAGQFTDEYDEAETPDGTPLSHLIAVHYDGEVVGTCRLVLTRHPAHPGLGSQVAEIANFGWEELAGPAGVPVGELAAGELGKFAVSPAANVRRVKWLLLTAAGSLAVRLGLHQVLALMPPLTERAARHAGVAFRAVPGGRLRRESPPALRYFLRYHTYFLPALAKSDPGFDPGRLESAPHEDLERALAGVPDGPRLWAIRSADLAHSPYPGGLDE